MIDSLNIDPTLEGLGNAYNAALSAVMKHLIEVSGGSFHMAQSLAYMAAERLGSDNHYRYVTMSIAKEKEEAITDSKVEE